MEKSEETGLSAFPAILHCVSQHKCILHLLHIFPFTQECLLILNCGGGLVNK